MTDWLKKQLTFQNIVIVLTFVAVLFRSSTAWVLDVTASGGKTAAAVQRLVEQTDRLTTRIDALERDRLTEGVRVALEFPRKSEIEPRLVGIEKGIEELNRQQRRMMETYRR